MVRRIFVEKKPGLSPEAQSLLGDLRSFLGIEALTGQVEEQSPRTVAEYRARLEAKMREATRPFLRRPVAWSSPSPRWT